MVKYKDIFKKGKQIKSNMLKEMFYYKEMLYDI